MVDLPESIQPSPEQVPVPYELVAEGQAVVAPTAGQGPKIDQEGREPISIFLFADGTGNSSAKLFKTNVWRMYEALDLGPPKDGHRVQIAYYDNGVGTSNFRPLRLLGGIFGIGLKANVLRLYSFLCENYQKGDRIYAFGFSRGAFTIRLLVGLIASQGILLRKDGEAPPGYQIRDAYRAVCQNMHPNKWPRWLARAVRAIRDQLLDDLRITLRRKKYSELERHYADVEFVGVWDTVAAYGGPFAELTRGIDDWVWPLTMPDYGLSPKVKKARHALSLDDERDAFHPLLWDEFREQQLVQLGGAVVEDTGATIRKVDPKRLAQVWFSGVHSDVGGGYPDESLSYISLLWMMDELSPPATNEVHFIDSLVQRARDLATPYGPIHDSRGGLASYYRYQPRKIAAMTDPADARHISLRDPAIGMGHPYDHLLRNRFRALVRATEKPRRRKLWLGKICHPLLRSIDKLDRSYPLPNIVLRLLLSLMVADEPNRVRLWRRHGLLKRVRVHETAIARIISGIDSYAPAAVPADFEIVSVKLPHADPAQQLPAEGPRAKPAMTKEDYDRFDTARALQPARYKWQERAWDLVWTRRAIYFATVFLSLAILFLPTIVRWVDGIEALCGDDRCFAKDLLEKPAFLLPEIVKDYWGPYLAAPFTLIVAILFLVVLMGGGEMVERAFRGRVRAIWRQTVNNGLDPASNSPPWNHTGERKENRSALIERLKAPLSNNRGILQRIRESRIYQSALFDLKWRFLPGVLGILTLITLVTATLLVVTQTVYALGEKDRCSAAEPGTMSPSPGRPRRSGSRRRTAAPTLACTSAPLAATRSG